MVKENIFGAKQIKGYLKDEFIFTKLDSVFLSDLVILGNICKQLSNLKELGEKCKQIKQISKGMKLALLKFAEIVCFVLQFALKISNVGRTHVVNWELLPSLLRELFSEFFGNVAFGFM